MLKLKLQYFGHLMRRTDSFEKTLMMGKMEGGRRGDDRGWDGWWHYWLDGHEFESPPGVSDGQGGLACCSPWGCKELDMTEQLNWTELFSPCNITSQDLFCSWKFVPFYPFLLFYPPLPLPSPLETTNLFSVSMSLVFCFCFVWLILQI